MKKDKTPKTLSKALSFQNNGIQVAWNVYNWATIQKQRHFLINAKILHAKRTSVMFNTVF
jgi:hypothetical protein